MTNWKRPLLYAVLSLLLGALLFFLAVWLAGWLQGQLPGPQGKWLGWLVPTAIGALLGLIAGVVVWKYLKALQSERQQRRYYQAQYQMEGEKSGDVEIMDRQTGAASRRCFDEILRREWWRSVRNQKPLSIILCSVRLPVTEPDQKVSSLKGIIAIFRKHVKRSSDLIARFDQEKLAVLLPETSLEGAARVSEMLRNSILEWIASQPDLQVDEDHAISLGAASCIPKMAEPPDHLNEVALHALEQAEKEGLIIVILSANS